MTFNLVSISALVLAAGITAASTNAFANLPDTAQGDATVNERHIISQAPLGWPSGVSIRREAQVMLRYTIEPDGHVDHVQVLNNPDSAFVDEAVKNVSSRVYSPSLVATTDVETLAKFHATPYKPFSHL